MVKREGFLSTSGSRFRDCRKALGLTQVQAAGLCGTNQGALSRLERDLETGSLDLWWRYATAIGANPASVDPRLASVKPKGRPKP
jgi:transcriptional regulator with XRE-family HTH domain